MNAAECVCRQLDVTARLMGSAARDYLWREGAHVI